MYKATVKVFEVANGELPGTSRKVLGWGPLSPPKIVEYRKESKRFFWGEMLCSVEYWIEFKQLEDKNEAAVKPKCKS